MENVILLALVATIGTWFITAMGAATVVFFKEGSPKAMNLMLGFSAGVMIAASFWFAGHRKGGDVFVGAAVVCGGNRICVWQRIYVFV